MSGHSQDIRGLTKNQTLVMGTLAESKEPLSAYTILDKLRDDGFRAPLQVYRALEKLLELGLVHRLETLNAFIACNHHGCDGGDQATAFMICGDCGKALEVADTTLATRLKKLAAEEAFSLQSSAIELRGVCQSCQMN